MREETARLERIVGHIASKVCWKYPMLDREEIVQEAWFYAVKAIELHDPARACLTTWVHRYLWLAFGGRISRRAYQRRFLRVESIQNAIDTPERVRFCLRNLLWQISPDAAAMVHTALKTGSRALLFKTLRIQGWNTKRIKKAFTEVKESL
jgi:DNA-directed RNA polymerase specialized sigma24 family protein